MYLRIFAAATLLAGSTALAMAQETPPSPPPAGGSQAQQTAPDAQPPGSERGDNARDRHHGKRQWRHHGKHRGQHHRGHSRGHGMRGKGFALSLGRHRELRVRCGDEPIEACIDAAAPLIDSLSANRRHHPRPGMKHGHGARTVPDRDDGTLDMDHDEMDMDQDDMGDAGPDNSPSAKPGYHADSPAPAMQDDDE